MSQFRLRWKLWARNTTKDKQERKYGQLRKSMPNRRAERKKRQRPRSKLIIWTSQSNTSERMQIKGRRRRSEKNCWLKEGKKAKWWISRVPPKCQTTWSPLSHSIIRKMSSNSWNINTSWRWQHIRLPESNLLRIKAVRLFLPRTLPAKIKKEGSLLSLGKLSSKNERALLIFKTESYSIISWNIVELTHEKTTSVPRNEAYQRKDPTRGESNQSQRL